MPIYAYRCEDCGFSKDVLQKVSDAPLTDCPTCGKSTFKKQLTAAGFQLKGTGWYVTDFRNNGSAPSTTTTTSTSSSTSSAPKESTSTETKASSTDSSTSTAPAA
jgi:putative FmdB family regulatory protein